MARPRKQTYTLEMFLKKINDGDIDNNADVQRHMVWSREQINELIVTVLTDEYIPPIILGEEGNSQLHITDGGCRSTALNSFWRGMHKINTALENSLIPYKRKVKRKDGTVTWEDSVFDIKNKTFDQLPEELKKKFNEYQIETVIHENCDNNKISKYIKRYNNHTSMNTDQKAFTYIDRFAGYIRRIVGSRFFLEHSVYTENEKTKGAVERVVVETIMCTNHFDNWKTQAKSACKYLNDNAAEEEFDKFAENLHRLETIITEDIKDIYNKKDSFVFLTLFDRFAEFLKEFKNNLRPIVRNRNGLLFDEIDKGLSTKNKQVVTDKLDMLEYYMLKYLQKFEGEPGSRFKDPGDNEEEPGSRYKSPKDSEEEPGSRLKDPRDSEEELGSRFKFPKDSEEEPGSRLKAPQDGEGAAGNRIEFFVAENLGMEAETVHEDMDLYNDSLDTLLESTVRIDSKLRQEQNRPSLLAMMVYSYRCDRDLDDWMAQYASRNNTYFADQKKNFLCMKADFEQFCRKVIVRADGYNIEI